MIKTVFNLTPTTNLDPSTIVQLGVAAFGLDFTTQRKNQTQKTHILLQRLISGKVLDETVCLQSKPTHIFYTFALLVHDEDLREIYPLLHITKLDSVTPLNHQAEVLITTASVADWFWVVTNGYERITAINIVWVLNQIELILRENHDAIFSGYKKQGNGAGTWSLLRR